MTTAVPLDTRNWEAVCLVTTLAPLAAVQPEHSGLVVN